MTSKNTSDKASTWTCAHMVSKMASDTKTSSSKKASKPEENQDNLSPICLRSVIHATIVQNGQDSVFCEGTCNVWIHRRCAGVSSAAFAIIALRLSNHNYTTVPVTV